MPEPGNRIPRASSAFGGTRTDRTRPRRPRPAKARPGNDTAEIDWPHQQPRAAPRQRELRGGGEQRQDKTDTHVRHRASIAVAQPQEHQQRDQGHKARRPTADTSETYEGSHQDPALGQNENQRAQIIQAIQLRQKQPGITDQTSRTAEERLQKSPMRPEKVGPASRILQARLRPVATHKKKEPTRRKTTPTGKAGHRQKNSSARHFRLTGCDCAGAEFAGPVSSKCEAESNGRSGWAGAPARKRPPRLR